MPKNAQTLREMLARSAETYKDRPCLGWAGEKPLTYEGVAARAAETAQMLAERGVAPGDKVAILSENKPNWAVAFFATALAGAVVVPILPDFHEDAVAHILRHCEAKALFVSQKLESKVSEGRFETLQTIIDIDVFHARDAVSGESLGEMLRAGRNRWDKLKRRAMKLAGREEGAPGPDDTAVLIYTSGTTGHSKGVMLSNANLLANARSAAALVEMDENERLLSILPLAHTYECTLGMILPIMCGASVHYLFGPPVPRTLLPALQKVRPTFLLCVPLVIEKIYRNRILPALTAGRVGRLLMKAGPIRKKLHKVAGKKLMETFGGELKMLCIGGAALAPDVERFLSDAGFPYAIGYGMTETSPLITGTSADKTRFRSAGPPIAGVEIRIKDPSPLGEGEILVRGDNVMLGYYKAPRFTAEVMGEDGWLHTGDLGVIDADGYLFFRGREKNVIVGASGENIYPEEIEALLNEYDYVVESLVYDDGGKLTGLVFLDSSRLDEMFGSDNMAESELAEKVEELLSRTRKEVNGRLAAFQRLNRIKEHPEPFEKTPTQKIKRFVYVK